MTHKFIQCILNSFAYATCALKCVCVFVLGRSRGGLQKSSHLPLSESRRSKLWERTEETHEIVFSCYFSPLLTGEKFQDRSQAAADSFGNGDRTKWSSSRQTRVRRESSLTLFPFPSSFPWVLSRAVKVSERWVTEVSCHLDTMLCVPGFRWVFLNALLHTVAPWGAQRPDRPRQCDAPKSVSQLGHVFWYEGLNSLMQKLYFSWQIS